MDNRPSPPKRSKVAVLYTRPDTVLADIARLMLLADYDKHLPKDVATVLKINISWQRFYPACSTTPWQLDGVIKTLMEDGYQQLIPTHNGTVVVDAHQGERANKHDRVLEKYGLPSLHLEEPPVQWVPYQPKRELLALPKIFPHGFSIPDVLVGKNIIHLPTMKTHVFTTLTGAMKNAFGGLLNHRRHWTHSVIHETLVDLLIIQKEIHPGLFAVM
ncbi:MAG: DUF362 domain-containing protein, partial [Chloroflexi bacterium]|nr:DUF362 domain-containing protein [Chloroflexota bacterium]